MNILFSFIMWFILGHSVITIVILPTIHIFVVYLYFTSLKMLFLAKKLHWLLLLHSQVVIQLFPKQ